MMKNRKQTILHRQNGLFRCALVVGVLMFGCNCVLGNSIPGAKPFHFTFQDIQAIGHERALPFVDCEGSWTINGRQYPKSRSLNAFEHGLSCDPNEDQTARINQLIVQASKDPEVDTVYFPKGVYYVSGHIYFRPGVNIVGAGQGKTVFERRDPSSYLVKGGGNDFKGMVVANLTLSNAHRTLLMSNSTNLKFFHVEFKGGIARFTDSKNLLFEGNVFNENLGKAGYASSDCKNVRIVNNTFNSIENGGINLSGHEDSYAAYNFITSPRLIDSGYAGIRLPNSANNNLVEYNYIQNHGRGLFVLSHSTGNTVQYNLVDGTTYQGVFVQSPRNTIKGNVVKDSGAEAIIVINGSVQAGKLSRADDNHVVDNIVYDTKHHDEERNIGLKVQTSGNVIEGNIVSVKYGRKLKDIKENARNTDDGNVAIE